MKIGDILICIDDNSSNEDLGMSGIVLKGRRDLVVGKEYEIESIITCHVPKQTRKSNIAGSPDAKIWEDEEYEKVKFYWTQVWLKGVSSPAWCHLFKLKQ